MLSIGKLTRNTKTISFVLAFAIIGTVVILGVRAGTTSIAIDTSNGIASGNAALVTNLGAKNGKAVRFGQYAPANFVHPGILVNRQQLDFVKSKVASGQQPWKNSLTTISNGPQGRTTYTPSAVKEVKCSSSWGVNAGYEQAGCKEQVGDSQVAYTQALLWYYTGNEANARKAIEIMDAWSYTNTAILFDYPRLYNGEVVYSGGKGSQIYANGKLQAGWSAANLTRAAEIIRHTSNLWPAKDITQMENYLKNVHLVTLGDGWPGGGNWNTTFAEAWTNIGIFTNDKSTYNKGIDYWHQYGQSLIYLNSDGEFPLTADPVRYPVGGDKIKTLWNNPSSYMDGQSLETCRDMGHTMMGLGSLTNTAETARLQGLDLYGEEQQRFIRGYERNTGYINQLLDRMAETGQNAKAISDSTWVPSGEWTCPDFKDGGTSIELGIELVLNHFNKRLNIPMPNTQRLAERARPSDRGNNMVWETLTHYQAP